MINGLMCMHHQCIRGLVSDGSSCDLARKMSPAAFTHQGSLQSDIGISICQGRWHKGPLILSKASWPTHGAAALLLLVARECEGTTISSQTCISCWQATSFRHVQHAHLESSYTAPRGSLSTLSKRFVDHTSQLTCYENFTQHYLYYSTWCQCNMCHHH